MIAIDLHGAEQFLANNRRFRGQLTRTVSRSLAKSLGKTAAATRRDIRGVDVALGITRSPWGKRKENRLTSRVKVIKLRLGAEGVEAAIGLYGYADVIEEGGRIVPHTIQLRGRTLQHPGAVVAKHGFGAAHLRRDSGAILRQLDEDIGQLVNRIYGL